MISLKPFDQLNKPDATDRMFTRHPENFHEGSKSIRLSDLLPFRNHPFKVIDNEEMAQLIESIQDNGVLQAIIARKHPSEAGKYEILSGHRRCHAAKLAGLDEVPCRIIEADDDAAVIMMTDTNLQREHILPSEKAWAYKMRYEAEKHQGKRTNSTSGQFVQKSTVAEMETVFQENYKQIQRYIRLTKLNKELIDKVDAELLPVNVGVDLSYLSDAQQKIVIDFLNETGKKIDLKLSAELHSRAASMTDAELTKLLYTADMAPKAASLSIPASSLERWFKPEQDKATRLSIIEQALDRYFRKQKEMD